MSVEVLAALGRSFQLGSLYDMRTEKIIAGLTLWDQEELDLGRSVHNIWYSDCKLITSNSLSAKTSALGINGHLSLSICSGLVQLSGSGEYLKEQKSSKKFHEVSLQYKCSTRSEKLTMHHLGSNRISHSYILDNDLATHVVTGIDYGANAVFVFEKAIEKTEESKDIKGKLEAQVLKIWKINLGRARGEYSSSDIDEQFNETIKCQFFGDFYLQNNPTTFSEAIDVYKKLPELLGEKGENSVPIQVHLLPLSVLDSRASRLVRAISTNLISDTEKTLEVLYELIAQSNDLLHTDVADRVPQIKNEIREFSELLITYKRSLQSELTQLVPDIRRNGNELRLTNLLKKKDFSPFKSSSLQAWIEAQENRIKILNGYISFLETIDFASNLSDLEAMVRKVENTRVLCLTIYVPKLSNQLESMRNYFQGGDSETVSSISLQIGYEKSISKVVRSFKEFRDINIDNENSTTKQIFITEGCDLRQCSATIKFFMNGEMVCDNYELPSVPRDLMITDCNVNYNQLTVQWKTPSDGKAATLCYYLTFREEEEGDFNIAINTAVQVQCNSCSATLPNLQPHTKYKIGVRAWCENGFGPCAHLSVCTRPASSPGRPTMFLISPSTAFLRWSPPQVMGPGCSVEQYRIFQSSASIRGKSWNLIKDSVSENFAKVSFLKNQPLQFAVVAICAPNGGETMLSEASHDSLSIDNLATTELKKSITRSSSVLSNGPPAIYELKCNYSLGGSDDFVLPTFEFGHPCEGPKRVVLLLGETGAGKTSLINTLANYILGVNHSDRFYFSFTKDTPNRNQAVSQTDNIVAYKLHYEDGFQVPYTVTFIDTPGFTSTQGINHDNQISEQIRRFFACGFSAIPLNALWLVMPSSTTRFTPAQQYVLDQFIRIFGLNAAENTFLLFTFADLLKPVSLKSIIEAGIPYNTYYKFNNCFSSSCESENNLYENSELKVLLWTKTQSNCQKLLNNLLEVEGSVPVPRASF